MKTYLPKFSMLTLVLLFFIFWATPCPAKIYKYQKDGVWYYSDTPPEEQSADVQEMAESGQRAPAPSPGGTRLLEAYTARNNIEKAAAAVVAVKSPMGLGSGFFISPDGFLLTNKHVIRTTSSQNQKNEAFFTKVEDRIGSIEKQLAAEKKRIEAFQERLDGFKASAQAESNPGLKQNYMEDYAARKKELQTWQADFAGRRKQFESEKNRFRSERSSYNYTASVADLSQSFTITLADNTELYVRLVAVSNQHDLALLKLDGYQVPFLKPAATSTIAQSDPVYAIGNPAKLKNSVTSGVFSGFEQGFIQTNAQIYPGNSGGPLVNAKGETLGINTFKKLTHKFEGLGFAIPIQVALREFSRYVGAP
jgi:S1-C subfamily serine protease